MLLFILGLSFYSSFTIAPYEDFTHVELNQQFSTTGITYDLGDLAISAEYNKATPKIKDYNNFRITAKVKL